MSLFCGDCLGRCQGRPERRRELARRLLEANTDANKVRAHAKLGGPVELVVVGEQHVGGTEGEVGTQARPLGRAQGVVKGLGVGGLVEDDGQEAAVAAVGGPVGVVMGPGGVVLGVVDGLDEGVGQQDVADSLGVCVNTIDAGGEVAAVALHEDHVLGPVGVVVVVVEGPLQGGVVAPLRVEDGAAAHDVGVAREDLGEATDDDVGGPEDVYVGKGADGLVDDDGEAVLVGQAADARQVGALEQRVARELAEEA